MSFFMYASDDAYNSLQLAVATLPTLYGSYRLWASNKKVGQLTCCLLLAVS